MQKSGAQLLLGVFELHSDFPNRIGARWGSAALHCRKSEVGVQQLTCRRSQSPFGKSRHRWARPRMCLRQARLGPVRYSGQAHLYIRLANIKMHQHRECLQRGAAQQMTFAERPSLALSDLNCAGPRVGSIPGRQRVHRVCVRVPRSLRRFQE